MHRPEQGSVPHAVQVTEVRFDAAVEEVLVREAAWLGVTVAEYVHDAALARAAFALRPLGEDPSDLLAGRARTPLDEEAEDADRRADQQRLIDALARGERREVP